jgi:hypothetical protein
LVNMVGGPRVGSGRPPDPNALRRDRKDDASWTRIPAAGREAPPPDWPLCEASDRELTLWGVFWRKPQAVLWEKNGQLHEVAMYVRTFAEAERPNAPANLRTLVKQQGDALLLTIPAMRQARVLIAADEVAERRTERSNSGPPKPSSRGRLRSAGGAGA